MEEETEEVINNKIAELQSWIEEEQSIPNVSGELFIRRFLHSCYFDINATKNALKAYYELRSKNPFYFSDRDPNSPEAVIAYQKGMFCLLPDKTDEDYKVMLSCFIHGDTSEYNFQKYVRWAFTMIDYCIHETIDELNPGFIIIVDCEHFGFSHHKGLTVDSLKVLINYLQETFPVRLKKILIINITSAMSMILNILKVLMASKLLSLIERYSKGDTSYLEHVPKRMMPVEYGGDYKSRIEIKDEIVEKMKENSEWFKKEDEIINGLRKEENDVEVKKGFFRSLF